MRTAILLALCLLAAGLPASPAVAGPGDPDESGAERTLDELYPVEFRVRVNRAIERGAQWLIRGQRPDGSWSFFTHHARYPMGPTALAVLTLLKCGIPKEHPAVVRAFAYLRTLPMQRTYSVSVLLMALDAKYAPARDPFDVEDVDRYGQRKGGDPCANAIGPEDLKWMREGVDFLLAAQQADGTWRYPQGGFDTSNTQFALLGLHAATRCGVKVDARVWLDALRTMLDRQAKTGEAVMYKANEVRGRYRFEWIERAIARGFRYTPDATEATGSMTTAGLTCLIVCQNRLWRARAFTGALRDATRRGARDAIAWLQTHFSVEENPGGPMHWHFYYLYGLERAGILGRFRFLGTRDWYKEGADYLLDRQRPGGDWPEGHSYEDTCFAILFLKRATTGMDAPVITPSGSNAGERPVTRKERTPADAPQGEPRTAREKLFAVARAIRDLESDDADVVFQAASRLGRLGHLRAVAPLAYVLRRHPDADARVSAANALGRLRAADAFEDLVHALLDNDDLVRFAAERALGAVGNVRLPERLAGADSRNDRVRLQKAWTTWWLLNEDAVRARLAQPRRS